MPPPLPPRRDAAWLARFVEAWEPIPTRLALGSPHAAPAAAASKTLALNPTPEPATLRRDAARLERFVEVWEPILPRGALDHVMLHLVLPRLRAAASAWDPLRDTVALHTWLHPWLVRACVRACGRAGVRACVRVVFI